MFMLLGLGVLCDVGGVMSIGGVLLHLLDPMVSSLDILDPMLFSSDVVHTPQYLHTVLIAIGSYVEGAGLLLLLSIAIGSYVQR